MMRFGWVFPDVVTPFPAIDTSPVTYITTGPVQLICALPLTDTLSYQYVPSAKVCVVLPETLKAPLLERSLGTLAGDSVRAEVNVSMSPLTDPLGPITTASSTSAPGPTRVPND